MVSTLVQYVKNNECSLLMANGHGQYVFQMN